ncbi:hypothetical protein [Curtobacterium sp. MCJR17_043]|uniref:hypothetical protein n=1 Tax=Curtobacterium sp. MCJR17_043 TaxID=2175660 RepID=UPI0024E0266D|nr:hypothetical protein [Curtobacterium sp. MCJR17_043]WIB36381.1 hypothetical protein DEJ15_04280 [Curtobacterium sp. MCJR17_043]
MTRAVERSLEDVVTACARIQEYADDPTLPEAVVADAVRMRLVDIASSVRELPPAMTATEPTIPWARLAALGEQLTRRPSDAPRLRPAEHRPHRRPRAPRRRRAAPR